MPIDTKSLIDIVKDSEKVFSKEIILNRAIPDLRDGLKPVQRRILYMAYDNHLLSNHPYMKSAKLSGLTLGLHPHGSVSIDDATATLSKDWNLNVPLIDIHGSNGGIDGSGPAASRYIEARLTKPAEYVLKDLDKNAVDFVDNYDVTMKEPTILPASWPVAMVNGTVGIAVGLATNILPHNPLEMMNGAIYLAKHPHGTDTKLRQLIPGPDFPTGGTIVGYDGAIDEYKSGRGRFIVRGTAKIDNKQKEIIISEVPYSITTTSLKESINKILDNHSNELGITGLDDNSSTNVKIVIRFKKKATKEQMQTTLNLLYQKSELETSISANDTMIWKNHPVTIGIKDYLLHFLNYRSQTLVRILTYRQKHSEQRLNIVKGLIRLIDIAEEVTKEAKNSNSRAEFEQILQTKFKFNAEQAASIAVIPLYRIGRQDLAKLQKEQEELERQIKTIKAVLSNKDLFLKYLIKDLQQTKKIFRNAKRKTKIIAEEHIEPVKIKKETLIKDQNVVIVIKPNGIIQRMSQQVFDNNFEKYSEKDNLVQILHANTRQGFIGFSNNGLSFFRYVNDLENQNINNDVDPIQRELKDFKSDDDTIFADNFELPLKEHQRYILSLTSHGMIKLMDEAKLVPNTNNKGYLKRSTKYNGLRHEHDQVVKTMLITEEQRQNATLLVQVNKKRTSDRTVVLSDLTIQGPAGSGKQLIKLDPANNETYTTIKLNDPTVQDQTEKPSDDQPDDKSKPESTDSNDKPNN